MRFIRGAASTSLYRELATVPLLDDDPRPSPGTTITATSETTDEDCAVLLTQALGAPTSPTARW